MSYQSFDNTPDQIDVQVLTSQTSSKQSSYKLQNEDKSVVLFGKDTQMTKSQLLTLILLSFYFFLSAAYYSLFAPFFPSEAISKNLTETHIGIIFGVFEFVIFILSPYFGKHLEQFGLRFLFVGGLFINSGSQFLFGFLDLCPGGLTFFIMCIACRAVTGIGVSMGLSFAIVGYYFPDKISFFVAILEIFNGLGFMIGPVIGGFLYELGGFKTPFFVMGGFLFFLFIMAFIFFPDPQGSPEHREPLPMLPFLKVPRFVLTLLLVFMCALSIGFLQPSIQLHLLPLQLTPLQIAFILMAPAVIYSVSTPIIGYICDKLKGSMRWIMFFSALIAAASFCIIGPIPILNMPLTLGVFIVGYMGFGLSIGGLGIPGYSELLRIALEKGYENDLRTQGVISGYFSSIWSMGSLVGPILGGYVVDVLGFNQASFGVVIAFTVSAFISLVFLVNDYCCARTNRVNDSVATGSERNSLLRNK